MAKKERLPSDKWAAVDLERSLRDLMSRIAAASPEHTEMMLGFAKGLEALDNESNVILDDLTGGQVSGLSLAYEIDPFELDAGLSEDGMITRRTLGEMKDRMKKVFGAYFEFTKEFAEADCSRGLDKDKLLASQKRAQEILETHLQPIEPQLR